MSQADLNLLSIGEMEDRYGVTKRTIRFYEQKGLLTPRRLGNRRYYDAQLQQRLELILFGKRCGLPLESIAVFLELDDTRGTSQASTEHIRKLFLEHLGNQKSQLVQLRANIEESEKFLTRLQDQSKTLSSGSVQFDNTGQSSGETILLD